MAKLDPQRAGAAEMVSVRLSQKTLIELDELCRTRAAAGVSVSRAQLMREALEGFLRAGGVPGEPGTSRRVVPRVHAWVTREGDIHVEISTTRRKSTENVDATPAENVEPSEPAL